MSDLPHIGPPEPTQTAEPPKPVSNDDQPFTARPYAPLIGFLELGESELNNLNQTKLQEIWDYLSKDSELTSERLYQLRMLENRLSPPKIGQSRLEKLHDYIKAQNIVEQAEKWRDGHLKGVKDVDSA